MPSDVAKQYQTDQRNNNECITKMTSKDGYHYMVKDGQAWRATEERLYQPIDWSRIK